MPQTIKAEELMTQQYKWIEEEESLGKALSSFNESCDVLLVKDEKQHYSGILTERMILRSGFDREKTKVKKLKRHAPKINHSTPIPDAAGLMVQNDVLHLPVCDKDQVIGILDDKHLLSSVAIKDFGTQNTKKFMTNNVHVIGPSEKISVVLHHFRDYHIGRLPVVDQGKLIGMITLHDVVTKMIQPRNRPDIGSALGKKASLWDLPVESIMTNPVITSSVSASIQDIIHKMDEFHVSGIPILDQTNMLVGIVTKKDILGPISLQGKMSSYPIIQFSSKLHGEYQDDLRPLVEQFAERHKERLTHATFSIFLREFNPEVQKLRLISVRCRLDSDFGLFTVFAEGWGPHNAMKQALILLERQIHRKISENREFARLYKKDFWDYIDIENLT
jgi:CBS domain-containing protein